MPEELGSSSFKNSSSHVNDSMAFQSLALEFVVPGVTAAVLRVSIIFFVQGCGIQGAWSIDAPESWMSQLISKELRSPNPKTGPQANLIKTLTQ